VSIQKTNINRSTVPRNGAVVSGINRASPRQDRELERIPLISPLVSRLEGTRQV
jgi:hypothetical protein